MPFGLEVSRRFNVCEGLFVFCAFEIRVLEFWNSVIALLALNYRKIFWTAQGSYRKAWRKAGAMR
jgi:hypothetical protein